MIAPGFGLPIIQLDQVCSSKITDLCSYKVPTGFGGLKYCEEKRCLGLPSIVSGILESVLDSEDMCSTITYPCDLEVTYKDLGLCEDENIRILVDKISLLCPCLNAVSSLSNEQNKMNNNRLSMDTSNAISSFSKAANCLINAGFGVRDNREEVVDSLVRGKAGNIVVFGPEIDSEFYVSFIGSVAVGANTGNWMELVNLFLSKFKEMKQVPSRLLEAIEKELETQVRNIVDLAQEISLGNQKESLRHLKEVLDQGQQVLLDLEQAKQTVQGLTSLDVKKTLLNTLQSGQIPDLSSSLDAFLHLNSFAQLQQSVTAMANSLQQLDLAEIAREAPSLENTLEKLQTATSEFRIRKFQVSAESVSYQRWVNVETEVPCTTTEPFCGELAGFRKCVEVPKFYACKLETRVPFPNHHLIYLELQLS